MGDGDGKGVEDMGMGRGGGQRGASRYQYNNPMHFSHHRHTDTVVAMDKHCHHPETQSLGCCGGANAETAWSEERAHRMLYQNIVLSE